MKLSWVICTVSGFLTANTICNYSCAEESELWTAGQYTFSDELGGFTIRAISGIGTLKDPIVVSEELDTAAPTTIVIRTERIAQLNPTTANGGLLFHLRVKAINGSGHPWIEFVFELQKQLGVPSDYYDGLSFYQAGDKTGMIHSDAFATYHDESEPYDRMIFRNGFVDPSATASFDFPVADFTPKRTFYLVQDPRIPST
jgi:hypothetical protein